MSFIETLLPYKTAILVGIVVLLASNVGTGFWAYHKGEVSKEAEFARASQAASAASARANSEAMARELLAASERVKNHTEINSAIEGSHDQTDDAPAPPAFQLMFNGLRELDGKTR